MSLTNIFPEDKSITLQLVDLYLKSSKNDEALKYIKIAKENDPGNFSLYYTAGIIFLNQNKFDDAISELTRSVELKSDFFENQYAMGIAYINKAADMNTKANEITDIKKYNEAVDQLNIVYAKALPFMEKAYELKPDDVYTMSRLQELYYRLKTRDPALNQKYLNIKAKIDAVEKK